MHPNLPEKITARFSAAILLVAACCLCPIQVQAEEEGQGGPEADARQAGHAVGSTMRNVGQEFKKIGKAIGHTARDVGKGVGNAAVEGGRAVKHGIKGQGDEERIK